MVMRNWLALEEAILDRDILLMVEVIISQEKKRNS